MTSPRLASPAVPGLSRFTRAARGPAEPTVAADCGRYFRSLRTRVDVSRLQLARRVGCDVSVLAALERGDATDLPPWPETVRIVTALATPLGLDPRVGLQLIGRIWGHGAPAGFAPPTTAPATTPPRFANIVRPNVAPIPKAEFSRYVRGLSGEWTDAVKRLSSLRLAWPASLAGWTAWRALFALVLVLTCAFVFTRPTSLSAMTSAAMAPVAELVRGARGLLQFETPSIEGGLRVIIVDDPRSRRGDRLPVAGRPG